MLDERFDRDFQAARADLNDGLDTLFATVGNGLRALHRIQWSAPWSAESAAPSKDVRRA